MVLFGLLKNKKALHIQANGGIYSHGPMSSFEHGATYVKSILTFFGIEDIEQIFIEGTNIQDLDIEKIKNDAIEKVKELARNF